MAILSIRTYPDTVLKQVAKEVTEITSAHQTLANDMLQTMYAAPGIGLAAPQVGHSIRLAVIDIRYRDDSGHIDLRQMTPLEQKVNFPLRLYNPVITKRDGKATFEEGCLSLPGYLDVVQRHEYVEFEAMTTEGKIVIKTDGLLAICIQHEIDHLDGKLFIDRLSTVKRTLIKTKIKKHGFSANEGQNQHVL